MSEVLRGSGPIEMVWYKHTSTANCATNGQEAHTGATASIFADIIHKTAARLFA